MADRFVIVIIDGKIVTFPPDFNGVEQRPIIRDDRVLIPVRGVLETMGYNTVKWNPDTQTVTAANGVYDVSIRIGDDFLVVNGRRINLLNGASGKPVRAQIIGGRMMVPANILLTSVGCKVEWKPDTGTVIVTSPSSARKKIVLDAGHGRNTPGKRTLNGANGVVREWTMNNNVCNYIASIMQEYNVDVLRADDVTGVADVSLAVRTKRINEINPDLSISIHHNAAGSGSAWSPATGIEVFAHPNKPKRDTDLAKLLSGEMAKLTGLRNRGAKTANLHMVRETRSAIPSLLAEGGFMDSTADYPVITSQTGQRQYAQAVANICISVLGLIKERR